MFIDSHFYCFSNTFAVRRSREEAAAPENELRKQPRGPETPHISEHEMRFRKSTEKLDVPEWYRENRPTGRATDLDATLSRPGQGYRQSVGTGAGPSTRAYSPSTRPGSSHSTRYSQPFSYMAGGYASQLSAPPARSPLGGGGLDIPRGMFDKYKDEIEELRRSRSSLHHVNVDPHREVVALWEHRSVRSHI